MSNFVIILRFTLRKTILTKKECITKFLFLKGTLQLQKKSVLPITKFLFLKGTLSPPNFEIFLVICNLS